MVSDWVKNLVQETYGGSSLSIGETVPHPHGYDVQIIAGQYWGDRGISNFWYWKRVDADGNVYGEAEHGYGWDAAGLKRKIEDAAGSGSYNELREHAIKLALDRVDTRLIRKDVDISDEEWKVIADRAATDTLFRIGSLDWTLGILAERPDLLDLSLAEIAVAPPGQIVEGTLQTAVIVAVRNTIAADIVNDLAAEWEKHLSPAPTM